MGDVGSIGGNLIETPLQGRVNMASGENICMKGLVDLLAKALVVSAKVIFEDEEEVSSPGNLVFNIAHLKKIIPGFQFTRINDGIIKYVGCLSESSN